MTRNRYIGSWQEPVSPQLSLPFEPDSVLRVLQWGWAPEEAPYSHQDIAHWCERFWNSFAEADAPPEIERLLPILADVETQWDLYLANSYSLKELQALDFQGVRLPTEWFRDWLRQAAV